MGKEEIILVYFYFIWFWNFFYFNRKLFYFDIHMKVKPDIVFWEMVGQVITPTISQKCRLGYTPLINKTQKFPSGVKVL